MNLVRAR
ncbi:hypothetical protein D030_1443A, partial [Vibrio parahaemolyticus AQ3810]